MPDTITTVLFDAAGTLFDLDPPMARLIADEVTAGGVPVTQAEIERAVSLVGTSEGWPDDQSSASARVEAWSHFVGNVLRAAGQSHPEPRTIAQKILDPTRYVLYPEARPVLDLLTAAGIRIAVVSNFDDLLYEILDATGITHYFRLIVTSYRFGAYKPDASIFQYALDQTGSLPHETLHVGDSPYSDIGGATAAGIHGVLVDRTGRHSSFAGTRIPSLTGVVPLIKMSG
ncbi:HAD-IA family hydrolase [Acrocarpospora sp. B8E8]|uniref:HAD family hydrolase n=1 Tax=Acrocarpospora sp. B8E8 TaxID=3153572 RepID=UPI00325DC6C9